jgi:hypothetical protein
MKKATSDAGKPAQSRGQPERSQSRGNEGLNMQVTETLAEGLKRELKVVVPAKDMDRS